MIQVPQEGLESCLMFNRKMIWKISIDNLSFILKDPDIVLRADPILFLHLSEHLLLFSIIEGNSMQTS